MLYKINGGNNNSPNSINVMVNYQWRGENRVITQKIPSMILLTFPETGNSVPVQLKRGFVQAPISPSPPDVSDDVSYCNPPLYMINRVPQIKYKEVTPSSSIPVPILPMFLQSFPMYDSSPILPSTSGLQWITFWRGDFPPSVFDKYPSSWYHLATCMYPHLWGSEYVSPYHQLNW